MKLLEFMIIHEYTMCRRPDIVCKLKFINKFYVLVSANIFSNFFLQIKVACVVNINFFFDGLILL